MPVLLFVNNETILVNASRMGYGTDESNHESGLLICIGDGSAYAILGLSMYDCQAIIRKAYVDGRIDLTMHNAIESC